LAGLGGDRHVGRLCIHCLVTPILLIALPFIGRPFWVDEHFHLWMLALVIPTTTLAVLSGCRRHKDRWVVVCSAVRISLLAAALWIEVSQFGGHGVAVEQCAEGAGCCETPADLAEAGHAIRSVTPIELVNVLGGLFLVCGHFRNFRLCRKHDCSHGMDRRR